MDERSTCAPHAKMVSVPSAVNMGLPGTSYEGIEALDKAIIAKHGAAVSVNVILTLYHPLLKAITDEEGDVAPTDLVSVTNPVLRSTIIAKLFDAADCVNCNWANLFVPFFRNNEKVYGAAVPVNSR